MKFVLNKEIVVLDKNGGSLILHNKALDKLYEISEEELECLQDYASETHESFRLLLLEKNYEENSITEISHFIEMAKENQILVEENYHYFLNRNLPKILYYLIVFFPFLEFIFIYNNKIFKIFEFKKFNFTIQLLTLFLFFICFAFSMYLMRDLVEYTSMIKVWILVLFISCSSIFHELGHLVSYKLLGGKSEKMGFGLMYYFYPVLYISTPTLYFWNNSHEKKKKFG